jgi:sulfoxide reductase heme-binding subunit YedZ
MDRFRRYGPPVVMNVLALVPLAWMVYDAAAGRLSADPIREIQLRTGLYAIVLIVVSLSSTPLYRLFGSGWLRTMRRISGLYAFGYAGLHLLNFVAVDYGFNLRYLSQGVIDKQYIIAGLAAFVLLIPAAVTSTRGWQRRLGKRWRYWHFTVYAAALLAVVHFIWQAKIDIGLPMVFSGLLVFLLALRLPFVSRLISLRRKRAGG